MEKITEKLLLERSAPKTSKLELIKTLNLSKLGLESKDLPVPLLCRLKCLEQLDLSGNRLQEWPPGLRLPSLRRLDLSNNDLENVTTLESLTSLEDVRVEDNLYLTVNDNYKLMILLPLMRVFNGRDVSTTANHVRFVAGGNLQSRVAGLWESDAFRLPDPSKREEVSTLRKEFVQKAVSKVQYGPKSISGYTKWRVERIAAEFFNSLIQPQDKTPKRKRCSSATESSPRKAPRVTSQDAVSPRKSSRIQNTPQKEPRTATASPRRAVQASSTRGQARASESQRALRERLPEGDPSQAQNGQPPTRRTPRHTRAAHPDTHGVDGAPTTGMWPMSRQDPVSLVPHCALQCHSRGDSPDDLSTQLWACAFQPPLPSSGGGGDAGGEDRIVATCGGDSVCFIDCETGRVMKKHKVPGEEFFTLAWSSVLMSPEGGGCVRPCRVLAAGGKRGQVKLIHPRANIAYGEFRASRRAISILRFSPRHGNFLFTGSYDKKIVMWDIGGLDKQYTFKVIQLLVLESTATPLHLGLPPSSPDTHLLAACEDGLLCYDIQLSKNTMKRSADCEVTFPVYEREDKDHDFHTIDGLAFLSEDVVASKSHMQGSIYLWSWSVTLAARSARRKQVCAVILMELQWSSTDVPYLSLNTCPSRGYVVCGDDRGRLWRYHITDLPRPGSKNQGPVSVSEIVEWPVGDGVKPASINSVAMDAELRYTVALTDKNLVVILKQDEC